MRRAITFILDYVVYDVTTSQISHIAYACSLRLCHSAIFRSVSTKRRSSTSREERIGISFARFKQANTYSAMKFML
jgi:hypothetical protein